MATSESSAPSSNPTYGVKIAGRVYPRRLRRAGDSPLVDAERERNGRIAERIWDALPWQKRSIEDFDSVSELVKCYDDSLRLLELRHQEAADLFWEVCRRNLTVTTSGFDADESRARKVETKLVQERFKQASFRKFKPDSVLSAELLGKPFDQVYKQLHRSLQQSTHRIIQSVFDAMDRLVDRSVLGVIEWTADEVCKFHFFREQSHYQRTKHTSHNQNLREIDADEDTWEVEEVSVTETREQEQSSRFRHEHHVMDARRLAHDSTEVPVPIALQPILHKLPDWLTPETQIVAGEQFCVDVIQQQRRNRQWLKEVVKKREVRVEYDPAIVIDRFVLTGWGEQEMLAEESRRSTETAKATREAEITQYGAGHKRAALIARCFGVGAIIFWGLGMLASSALIVLSVLCLCISLWQTTRALDNAAHFYRKKPAIGYIAAGIAGKLCLWGGWMLVITALILGPRWVALIGIAITFLEGPLLRNAEWWVPRSLHIRQK